jgi:cytoskeletal protein CcmA (bactofilin family)
MTAEPLVSVSAALAPLDPKLSSRDVDVTLNLEELGILSRVAKGCESVGSQIFRGGVLIEGSIKGPVHVSGNCVIGPSGLIRGSIRCTGTVYVFGRIEADSPDHLVLVAERQVVLANGAIVIGRVLYNNVEIFEGVKLAGSLRSLTLDNHSV